jgi:hypothetical protein
LLPPGFAVSAEGVKFVPDADDYALAEYPCDSQGYTMVGSNVPVSSNINGSFPPVTGASITFSQVSTAGVTSASASNNSPAPPDGFRFASSPPYVDLVTTAAYTSPITVCLNYDASSFSSPNSVQLLHYQNGAWQNVTNPDSPTVSGSVGTVCGTVSSLSPFLIGQPEAPAPTATQTPTPTPTATPTATPATTPTPICPCWNNAWKQFGCFKNQGACVTFCQQHKERDCNEYGWQQFGFGSQGECASFFRN